jgi:ADP-ribosylglycohydrolase
MILRTGLLVAMLAASLPAAPRVLEASTLARGPVRVRYPRVEGGSQVAHVTGLDLDRARSVRLQLASAAPTQLKIFLVWPDGLTRVRYVVLSPTSLRRTLKLSVDAFDPFPDASWEEVPEGGALIVSDVPALARLAKENRLELGPLEISRNEVALPEEQRAPENPPDPRIHGAWLGKALGGHAGMAGEGRGEPNWEAIEREGWEDLAPSAGAGFGPDDDSTLGVAAQLATARLGAPPTPMQLAFEWMSVVSPEFHWTNGWNALARIRKGTLPPKSGEGPLGATLSARIRIEPWGLLASSSEQARAWAEADASITSHGVGKDDAVFVAGALAAARDGATLDRAIQFGIAGAGEEYRGAFELGQEAKAAGRSLREAWAEAKARFLDPIDHEDAWVFSLPNAALMGIALAYAEGDPVRVLRLAAHLGWDSDCNAGTLGAILGAVGGPEAFPEGWRARLGDRLRVAITGQEHWSIAQLAARTTVLRAKLRGDQAEGR